MTPQCAHTFAKDSFSFLTSTDVEAATEAEAEADAMVHNAVGVDGSRCPGPRAESPRAAVS